MKILSGLINIETKVKCSTCKVKYLIGKNDWVHYERWVDRMEDMHPEGYSVKCPVCKESYSINSNDNSKLFYAIKQYQISQNG